MSGDYKVKKKKDRKQLKASATSLFPCALFPMIASAHGDVAVLVATSPEVIPVVASEWMSETALETHSLTLLIP